jgi:hypothetical protein
MLTRVLVATLVGGIAFFITGGVVYGLVLDPMLMKPNMTADALKLINDPPIWAPLILANFVNAFLLAYIFDRWAGIRTFVGGMKGGAIVFGLMAVGFQLMFMAFMKIMNGYMPAVADVIGSIVVGGIGGGVVGLVLGKLYKE